MPLSITLRANKGKALTYEELDGNFGAFFYSSSLSSNGQVLNLHYTSSVAANINEPHHSIPLIADLSKVGSDKRVAFFTGSSALATTSGFVVDQGNVGVGVDESDDLPLSYRLEVSGSIKASGTVIQGSDRRLKEDIKPIAHGLDKVEQLLGVNYKLIGTDKKEAGFIAQDIQEIIPEVVSEDNKGYLGVNYSGVVPYLVEAIKDLKQELEAIKRQL